MTFMDDEPAWDRLSTEELAELAAGRDLWVKAPALGALEERSPDRALPIARKALREGDDLVAATALRVLAHLDPDAALRYMEEVVESCSMRLLDAMVEVLAVDSPVSLKEHADLLLGIAARLQVPVTDEELYLAELFFYQYPELRDQAP
jgi:hypothetical protein